MRLPLALGLVALAGCSLRHSQPNPGQILTPQTARRVGIEAVPRNSAVVNGRVGNDTTLRIRAAELGSDWTKRNYCIRWMVVNTSIAALTGQLDCKQQDVNVLFRKVGTTRVSVFIVDEKTHQSFAQGQIELRVYK